MKESIKANRKMQRLLSKEIGADRLDPELLALLQSGFSNRYGCIFYAGFEQSVSSRARRKELWDKTGIECSANHIHLEDYVKLDPLVQFRQAVLFVKQLARLLGRSYPRTSFRVILSVNRDGAIVRFHKVRAGEEWLSDDLEGYKDDALYVLTISPDGKCSHERKRFWKN